MTQSSPAHMPRADMSAGAAACDRLAARDRAEQAQDGRRQIAHGDGTGDEDIESALAKLIPAPGSPRESVQLRRLRALQDARQGRASARCAGEAPFPDEEASTSASSSSSRRFKSCRRTTTESGPDGAQIETELYWSNKNLIWSRNGLIYRTFSYDERVQCATWASIDVGPPGERSNDVSNVKRPRKILPRIVRALCIVLQTHLVIFEPYTGKEHTKRLDFEVLTATPLDVGLLIQRTVEQEDRRRSQGLFHRPDINGKGALEGGPLPSLFYLRRPLDELRAVELADEVLCSADSKISAPKTIRPRHGNQAHLFNKIDERIFFSSQLKICKGHDLVVTCNEAANKICLYALAHDHGPLPRSSLVGRGKNVANSVKSRLSETALVRPAPLRKSSAGHISTLQGRPRASSIGRGRQSLGISERSRQSRVSSGASHRTSSAMSASLHAPNALLANEEETEETDDHANVRHMMQFLNDLDELNEDSISAQEPVTDIFESGLQRRRSGRMSTLPLPSATGPAASIAANLMRTPFPKGKQAGGDDMTALRRRRQTSYGLHEAAAQPSVAAYLGQQDEASKLTMSVSRPAPRISSMKRSHVEADDAMDIDVKDSRKRSIHGVDDGQGDDTHIWSFQSNGQSSAALAPVAEFLIEDAEDICPASIFLLEDDDRDLLCVSIESVKRLYVYHINVQQCGIGQEKLVATPLSIDHANQCITAERVDFQQNRPERTDIVVHVNQAGGPRSYVLLSPLGPASLSAAPTLHSSQHLWPRCFLSQRVLTALQGKDSSKGSSLGARMYSAWVQAQNHSKGEEDWKLFCAIIRKALDTEHYREHTNPYDALLSSSVHERLAMIGTFCRHESTQDVLSRPKPTSPKDDRISKEDSAVFASTLHDICREAMLDHVDAVKIMLRALPFLMEILTYLKWNKHLRFWSTLFDEIHLGRMLPVAPEQTSTVSLEEPVLDAREALEGQGLGRHIFPKLSRVMMKLQASLSGAKHDSISGQQAQDPYQRAKEIVELLAQENIASEFLPRLSTHVLIPLIGALRACRLNPPRRWPLKTYALIRRPELFEMTQQHRRALVKVSRKKEQTADRGVQQSAFLTSLHPMCAKLFNLDFRLADVAQMLQTKGPVATRGPADISSSADEDFIAEKQKRVFISASERIKATSVGRGMFMVNTDRLNTAEQVVIPPLNMKVRMLCNCIVQHREPDADSTEMEWPEFHNGVAAALQLEADGALIESSWIFNQSNNEFTPRRAGFLFGLGLQGLMQNLGKVHAHYYLSQRHPMTTIGLLLGISVSFLGSCDTMAKALMSIHLVHALPLYSKPLKTTMLEQSAALLGLGLVYLGSRDRWAARMALKAINSDFVVTDDSQTKKRACYALSAGFSLGLTCLGQGTRRKQNVDDDLEREIVASLDTMIGRFSSDEGSAPFIGAEARLDSQNDYASFEWRPDITLTSTPATIALALIYLKSGRRDIADKFPLPQLPSQLDEIRPDLLQIRVLCRSLIMWDEIEPSMSWLDKALPPILSFTNRAVIASASESRQLAYWTMRTGAIFALGLKFAGSHDPTARDILMDELHAHQAADTRAVTYFEKLRQQALRSAIDVILSCLAMVMAGSGDIGLLTVLRKALYKVDGTRYGNYMASTMAIGLLFLGGGRFTIATHDLAIVALLIAFYPRYPVNSVENHIYLQAYRHFWILAVDRRLVHVEECGTAQTKRTPISVHLQSESGEPIIKEFLTPCLLPKLDTVCSIALRSPRYQPFHLVCDPRKIFNKQTLHARRKLAHLDYESDPNGRASFAARQTGRAVTYKCLPCLPAKSMRATLQMLVSVQYQVQELEDIGSPASLRGLIHLLSGWSNSSRLCLGGNDIARLSLDAVKESFLSDNTEALPVLLGIIDGIWRCKKKREGGRQTQDYINDVELALFAQSIRKIDKNDHAHMDALTHSSIIPSNLRKELTAALHLK